MREEARKKSGCFSGCEEPSVLLAGRMAAGGGGEALGRHTGAPGLPVCPLACPLVTKVCSHHYVRSSIHFYTGIKDK